MYWGEEYRKKHQRTQNLFGGKKSQQGTGEKGRKGVGEEQRIKLLKNGQKGIIENSLMKSKDGGGGGSG